MRVLLALTAAAAPISAQKEHKTPAPTHAAKPAQASTPTPAPKEASVKVEPVSLLVHVTGLTKDNQTAVEQVLSSLGPQEYVCPKCKHTQAVAGQCPTCKVDLKSERRHTFSGVRANLEAGSLALTPSPHAPAKLSEIENALAPSAVRVDETRLTLPGSSMLVVAGGSTADAAAIEKALTAPGLFQEAHARFDAALNVLDVNVRAGFTAPLHSAVTKAIVTADAKARLTDIVWGSASPAHA